MRGMSATGRPVPISPSGRLPNVRALLIEGVYELLARNLCDENTISSSGSFDEDMLIAETYV